MIYYAWLGTPATGIFNDTNGFPKTNTSIAQSDTISGQATWRTSLVKTARIALESFPKAFYNQKFTPVKLHTDEPTHNSMESTREG